MLNALERTTATLRDSIGGKRNTRLFPILSIGDSKRHHDWLSMSHLVLAYAVVPESYRFGV